MDKATLQSILKNHKKFLTGEDAGEKANLYGADLREANLYGANLRYADLSGADLSGADLSGADLRGADLRGANLSGADLRNAYLHYANLLNATLSGAYLGGANLNGANLHGADLHGADLRGANLRGAKNIPKYSIAATRILPEGSIIGWKKCVSAHGIPFIVKLRIPEEARRSHAMGRKCRAEYADVLEILGNVSEVFSLHNKNFKYVKGERVFADQWNEDWTEECTGGIHFFITKEEAEAY